MHIPGINDGYNIDPPGYIFIVRIIFLQVMISGTDDMPAFALIHGTFRVTEKHTGSRFYFSENKFPFRTAEDQIYFAVRRAIVAADQRIAMFHGVISRVCFSPAPELLPDITQNGSQLLWRYG